MRGPDDTSREPAPTFDGQELELDYPCPWSYTIIGPDEERLRQAVAMIVGDRDHSLRFSHESKGGKYCSLSLELVVDDNMQRLGFFTALHAHVDVKFVL